MLLLGISQEHLGLVFTSHVNVLRASRLKYYVFCHILPGFDGLTSTSGSISVMDTPASLSLSLSVMLVFDVDPSWLFSFCFLAAMPNISTMFAHPAASFLKVFSGIP